MHNGYFLTGDLGYYNNDGYFFFSDRSKDLIIKANPNLNLKKAFEEKRLIENMSVDKKKTGDKLTFILLKEIGKAKIRTDIAESHIAKAIRSLV